MAFVEFTRVLPKNKTVKWSVNQANVVYFQEPVDAEAKVGCTLVNVAGVEVNVTESYEAVGARLKES